MHTNTLWHFKNKSNSHLVLLVNISNSLIILIETDVLVRVIEPVCEGADFLINRLSSQLCFGEICDVENIEISIGGWRVASSVCDEALIAGKTWIQMLRLIDANLGILVTWSSISSIVLTVTLTFNISPQPISSRWIPSWGMITWLIGLILPVKSVKDINILQIWCSSNSAQSLWLALVQLLLYAWLHS